MLKLELILSAHNIFMAKPLHHKRVNLHALFGNLEAPSKIMTTTREIGLRGQGQYLFIFKLTNQPSDNVEEDGKN